MVGIDVPDVPRRPKTVDQRDHQEDAARQSEPTEHGDAFATSQRERFYTNCKSFTSSSTFVYPLNSLICGSTARSSIIPCRSLSNISPRPNAMHFIACSPWRTKSWR